MRGHIFFERIGRGKTKVRDGKWQEGFTLAEILITVAVIAIISAIAIPTYSRYSLNTDLKAAARNIQADFLDLRERAISENTKYQITFDQNGNSYTIQRGTETGAPYTPIEVRTFSDFGSDGHSKCRTAARNAQQRCARSYSRKRLKPNH